VVKLSAFADEVTDDFIGQVKFLTDNKVNFIEIRFVDKKNIMDLNASELKTVKQMLNDNGIGVSAIGSPIGKVRLDQPFEAHLDQFKHALDLAHNFETPFIRMFSYYPPEGKNIDNYRNQVLDRMHAKVELMAGIETIMVHENETGIYGYSAENCVDIVKTINSPKLRLAYDSGNFVWGQDIGNNIEECWPIMQPYVVHIHIKDWKLGDHKVGSIPGEGDGQISGLLLELVKMNYSGFIAMEPHLKHGGQFGGETGPELFSQAIDATRAMAVQNNLHLH